MFSNKRRMKDPEELRTQLEDDFWQEAYEDAIDMGLNKDSAEAYASSWVTENQQVIDRKEEEEAEDYWGGLADYLYDTARDK